MEEEMSDRDLDDLHPTLRPLAVQWLAACKQQEIDAIIDFTWRSPDEQDALYAQGRTTPGKIVTNARGGQSAHNVTAGGKPAACAFDFAIQNPDGTLNWDVNSMTFKAAVAIGKGLGLAWGGSWPGKLGDYVHFELPDWKTIAKSVVE
jgi:peptidoglycan LD-endopeptidase CwlK